MLSAREGFGASLVCQSSIMWRLARVSPACEGRDQERSFSLDQESQQEKIEAIVLFKYLQVRL